MRFRREIISHSPRGSKNFASVDRGAVYRIPALANHPADAFESRTSRFSTFSIFPFPPARADAIRRKPPFRTLPPGIPIWNLTPEIRTIRTTASADFITFRRSADFLANFHPNSREPVGWLIQIGWPNAKVFHHQTE